jgi:flagellar biogenesis protein FliO
MDLAGQLAAVLFVIALLWLVVWVLRRKGVIAAVPRGRRGERSLELLERQPLSPQHSIHLIRSGERRFLIGAHPSGLTVIWDSHDSHPRS